MPLEQKAKVLETAVQALKQKLISEKKVKEQLMLSKQTLETQVKQATGNWFL